MMLVRISSSVLRIGWNSISPLDFLPPPPNICLVRVPTSCRGRPRSKNIGAHRKRQRHKKSPLNGPFNDNSSSVSVDNIENESAALDIRLESAQQVVCNLDPEATPSTKYSQEDAPHRTLESGEEVMHIIDPAAKPSSENNEDALSDRTLDSVEGLVIAIPGKEHQTPNLNGIEEDAPHSSAEEIGDVIDPGAKPWSKDSQDGLLDTALDSAEELVLANDPVIIPMTKDRENLDGLVDTPDATNALDHFSDHPVPKGLSVDYNSNETRSAPLHFAEGSVDEVASYADLVTDNAHYTEPVTDASKHNQEVELEGSIHTPNMTEALVDHRPVPGDWPSFTNYNGEAPDSEGDNSFSGSSRDGIHLTPEVANLPPRNLNGRQQFSTVDSVPEDAHSACSATDASKYTEPVIDEFRSSQLHFKEDSAVESASYPNLVTGNSQFTEPVTNPTKQSQELSGGPVNAPDMTKPLVHHLPTSGDWSSFTDYNINESQTASIHFEADSVQEDAYSAHSVTDTEEHTEPVIKRMRDEEVDLDGPKLFTEAAEIMGIADIREQHPVTEIQLEVLRTMISNAEKNVLLLNQARLRALEAVDQILKEKEKVQEINMSEMRLAETDAQLKVATQEKINAEPAENQLQELREDVSQISLFNSGENFREVQHTTSCPGGSSTDLARLFSISEKLKALKEDNISLKCEFEVLKSTVSDVRELNDRLLVMEKGRSEALGDLELKLASVRESFIDIKTLQSEFNALCGKVEQLQYLLESTSRQAESTADILQRNHEFSKRFDELEASLKEVNSYKSSSEQSQQYNKLLERQIGILEEHVLRSDLEIQSQVHLYRESVNEFHKTLRRMKEENDRRKLEKPVDDMPWDFWSHLLLYLDSWLLEKKISFSNANALREMAWKRNARIRDAFMTCKDKQESEAMTAFLKLVSSNTSPGMHVVHIAAEMAPVAKVGDLGDVVSGLGKALQRRGHLVEIILPKYDCMQYSKIDNLKALNVEVESYFDGQLFKNKIWVGIIEGLPVYFIEPHHPAKFFRREKFYGENDDFRRFSFFSRAALEFLYRAGKKPNIIHCHDWQTAFTAPLYWHIYAPKGFNSARICFTCHNFEYQGTASASDLASCGLDATELNRQDRMQDNKARDRVNSVKGGIVFSNIVTTVSPTYAQEVQTIEGGHGLHHTLHSYSKRFFGILNGIDTDAWNPATDAFLRFQYTADDLQGKRENKEAFRKQLALASADTSMPMVGCIARLVPQKGAHLIRHAIHRTLELGGQFVLLGSSPVPHIQREFQDIADHFHNHQNIRLILKYDEALAHTIYAGADMLVIPSIFEPCGLTQMISMRYGSIPIVRRIGGLNDSVFDVDDETIPLQFRNGFTFTTAGEQELNGALDRAFDYYKRDPEKWQQLVKRAMSIDFSWKSSAKQYEDLYEKSLARARVSTPT